MLATFISLSGDEAWLLYLLVFVVASGLIISALLGIIKAKEKEEEQRRSQQPPQQIYIPMYPPKEEPKVTKTPDKTCIFCGEGMDEKQTFCGKCGRRQD